MPMPPDLTGLWVDLGHQDRRGRWVREPVAEFTCRHGCARYAQGPVDVAQFCRLIAAWHTAHCPARKASTDDHS